jgi:hypothetical protein
LPQPSIGAIRGWNAFVKRQQFLDHCTGSIQWANNFPTFSGLGRDRHRQRIAPSCLNGLKRLGELPCRVHAATICRPGPQSAPKSLRDNSNRRLRMLSPRPKHSSTPRLSTSGHSATVKAHSKRHGPLGRDGNGRCNISYRRGPNPSTRLYGRIEPLHAPSSAPTLLKRIL